jgi:hypothetical protein
MRSPMPCQCHAMPCHAAAGRRARAPASSPASPSATAERINSSTYAGAVCACVSVRVCVCVCVCVIRYRQAGRQAGPCRRITAAGCGSGSTRGCLRQSPVAAPYRAHSRTHAGGGRCTRSHRPWPRVEYSRTACTAHSCGGFGGADRSAQTRSGGSGARGCRRSPPQSRPSLRQSPPLRRTAAVAAAQAAARSSYLCATSRTLIHNLAVRLFAIIRTLIRSYPYPYSQSAVPLFATSGRSPRALSPHRTGAGR